MNRSPAQCVSCVNAERHADVQLRLPNRPLLASGAAGVSIYLKVLQSLHHMNLICWVLDIQDRSVRGLARVSFS